MDEKSYELDVEPEGLTDEVLLTALSALRQATPISPQQAEIRSALLASMQARPSSEWFRIRPSGVAAAVATVLMVLSVGLFVSSDLRVLAQDLLDFFIRGREQRETEVFVGGSPPEDVDYYPLSLDELRAQTGQALYLPTVLPEGYSYDGGSYYEVSQTLVFTYSCQSRYLFGLLVRPMASAEIVPVEVGANAEIVDVDVNGSPGQYVRGFWVVVVPDQAARDAASASDEVTSIPAEAVWTNDSDFQQLWWYDDISGLSFLLSTFSGSMHGRHTPMACTLDMEDYVAIARGVSRAEP